MDTINDVFGTSWQLGPILLARWAFRPGHTADAWQMLTKGLPAAGCRFLPPLDYHGASDTLAARVSFKEWRRVSGYSSLRAPATWGFLANGKHFGCLRDDCKSFRNLLKHEPLLFNGTCLLQAMPMA